MTLLLDTSFLLAAAFLKDRNHPAAAQYLSDIDGIRFITAPVIIELFFMVVARVSYDRAVLLFDLLRASPYQIIDLIPEDRERMSQLMRTYQSAALDIADCAQIAIAERLNITTIATFDRRDFSIVRPLHTSYFTLVP